MKLYVSQARQRRWLTPPELHRRFEVLPGAQAQVDWGDEGVIDKPDGPVHVYSFHMTLSFLRDPSCCFVTCQDLVTFWDCHRRAFAHFGDAPQSIVYDRTKTVVRKHVRRHESVPLHPEAIAFASHYGFSIVVAPAYRPEFKSRVERQVSIVRHGVLDGHSFCSIAEMDEVFMAWLPIRRAKVHRTHGEVIAVWVERDRAALYQCPSTPMSSASATCARFGGRPQDWKRDRTAGSEVIFVGPRSSFTHGSSALSVRRQRSGVWAVDGTC